MNHIQVWSLEEYLEALHNCPDEQLNDKLGIDDNWPIILNANPKSFAELLVQSGNYETKTKRENKTRILLHLDYVPGAVEMRITNGVGNYCLTRMRNEPLKLNTVESERQLRDYNMSITLHPYPHRHHNIKIEGVSELRAMAIVIEEIGQLAIRENIPVCMTKTIGWKYHDAEEYPDVAYPRVVYHQPNKFNP